MFPLFSILAILLGFFMPRLPHPDHAGDMLPLLKRHEIQILHSVKMPPSKIAARVGVSTDTVQRVCNEAPVSHLDDPAERRRRGLGRPSKTVSFADAIQRWLEEEPELPTQELLRRAMEDGYTGAKSAFYALVAAHRPVTAPPIVRFEGLPGEFSQHDFGQLDVSFVDGRKKRIHFFASRLKFSRFVAVSIVPDEKTETLVRTLVKHFHTFEGVPLLAVFDRPRTIVTKSGRGREVELFHSTFAQVMLELGVGIEMCAARSGNQKGAVEHVVKWVKNTFFKWRKFIDEQDLHTKLAEWVDEVNLRTKSRATGEFPETLRQQELPRLRPVRLVPESLALPVPIVVGPTAEIAFEGNRYSMPAEAANSVGTAFVYEARLHFVAGRHQAEHERHPPSSGAYALAEHRADKLAAVQGKRARLYEMRQQLLQLGPAAMRLLTHLTHRSPTLSAGYVEDLYKLMEQHGEVAMRGAFDQVSEQDTLSVSAVRKVLETSARREGRAPARSLPPSATARTATSHSAPRSRRAEPTKGRR